MKRIFLALTILAMTLAVLSALNSTAARSRQQLRSDQTTWRAQTRELAAVQTEQAALAEKVRELKRKLGAGPVTAVLDPALAEFLASNDIQSASPEMQDKLLAGF